MKLVKDYFNKFYTEIGKYKQGIHVLNDGISETEVNDFEVKYHMYLPFFYREWLKMNNGGELFTPGTVLARILGNEEYEEGTLYVENNFDSNRRWPQMPNYLFIIAKECTGDAIGFDLRRTNKSDGVIIYWDHETGKISREWNNLAEWLDYEMEMGKGFLFEKRQKRFTFDEDNYFVDLVLYNRLLRCYVLIDLKVGTLSHQDLGQMQMYVNYYDREVKTEFENPTVGILLCKENKEAMVKLTLPPDANIYASEYKLYLPDKKLLQDKLRQWIEETTEIE